MLLAVSIIVEIPLSAPLRAARRSGRSGEAVRPRPRPCPPGVPSGACRPRKARVSRSLSVPPAPLLAAFRYGTWLPFFFLKKKRGTECNRCLTPRLSLESFLSSVVLCAVRCNLHILPDTDRRDRPCGCCGCVISEQPLGPHEPGLLPL